MVDLTNLEKVLEKDANSEWKNWNNWNNWFRTSSIKPNEEDYSYNKLSEDRPYISIKKKYESKENLYKE